MNIKTTLKTAVAAAVVTIGTVAASGATPASALGSDIDGDRISWYSTIPCSDGGGVSVYARAKFTTRTAGSYRMSLALYSTAGGRLAFWGPLQWNNVGANNVLVYPPASTWSGFGGEAEMVAFVYRWNGSSWALVARETIPCL